jgi:hypothetical protein
MSRERFFQGIAKAPLYSYNVGRKEMHQKGAKRGELWG